MKTCRPSSTRSHRSVHRIVGGRPRSRGPFMCSLRAIPLGPTEHSAHLSRVVSCHADHRPPRMHGANFSSPPSPQTVHTSGMAWTSTEVQQFTDAEHPAMGHSGMEGWMTGTAPPQGTHPEGEHGTRVMSLGVGTIRTGSGKRPRVTGPECASEGHPVYRILTAPVVCYCVRSARWKSRRPTRRLCSLTHRTTY